MICDNCSRELKKNWGFCPFCGKEKNNIPGVGDIFKIMKNQFKVFDNLVSGHKFEFKPMNLGDGRGFRISIGTDAIPKMSYKEKKPLKKKRFGLFKKFKREEAKGKLKRLGSGLRYEIYVPGIKSIDDVEIVRLNSSIEVRCYVGRKEFFKLIPLDFGVKRHYIDSDKLVIELVE